MNEVLNAIITRRSCKSFKPDMISQQDIDQVIESDLYAASGLNTQSPIIIAVTDKETRDLLSALNRKYDPRNRPDPFYGAPVVLVVLAPRNIPTYCYDGSLVLGNLMLAAHSLGLGSCWVHRAKETFEEPEGQEILKRLGITGDYEGIGNCVLGIPATEKTNNVPERKENRVYRISG